MEKDIEFYQYIEMDKIKDSMQLDSEQTIAWLRAGEKIISLEVRGEVKVWWNPNATKDSSPINGEYFKYPSEFPEELKELIKNEQYWDTDERVCVSQNNWFELFICKNKNDLVPDSVVVDVEGLSSIEIYEMMYKEATRGGM